MSCCAIGKGDGEAASWRELERRNVVLVWGFVQGQWGGTRHQGSSTRKKKKTSLTFASLLMSLLKAAFGNTALALMDHGSDLIVLLRCSYVAELWVCC